MTTNAEPGQLVSELFKFFSWKVYKREKKHSKSKPVYSTQSKLANFGLCVSIFKATGGNSTGPGDHGEEGRPDAGPGCAGQQVPPPGGAALGRALLRMRTPHLPSWLAGEAHRRLSMHCPPQKWLEEPGETLGWRRSHREGPYARNRTAQALPG